MGGNCGASATHYKRGHDPAYWYTPIASACKASDIPMTASDAGATTLPTAAFTWITPNQCHNHHWESGCTGQRTSAGFTQAMDTWLAGTIQAIQATADYQAGQTLIFVTFDEGQGGTNGRLRGSGEHRSLRRVVTIAIAAGVRVTADTTSTPTTPCFAPRRRRSASTYLGNATGANDMRTRNGLLGSWQRDRQSLDGHRKALRLHDEARTLRDHPECGRAVIPPERGTSAYPCTAEKPPQRTSAATGRHRPGTYPIRGCQADVQQLESLPRRFANCNVRAGRERRQCKLRSRR